MRYQPFPIEKVKQNRFPPSWDEERVQRVLAHYEEQAEAVAEDEAAFEDRSQTVMEIPTEPVRRPSLLELVASWEPLDEDFPEIEDPPPLDDVDL
jgi:hypothetical protein